MAGTLLSTTVAAIQTAQQLAAARPEGAIAPSDLVRIAATRAILNELSAVGAVFSGGTAALQATTLSYLQAAENLVAARTEGETDTTHLVTAALSAAIATELANMTGSYIGAPNNVQYIVAAASSALSAERVATSTASIAVDNATAAQTQFKRAALTGDVTASADSNATTLAAGSASVLNSGTLPAGRMPALTGDVTTSVGTVATTIAADAVTFAKMQNISTDRLIGRDLGGSGDATEIELVNGLGFSGANQVGIEASGVTTLRIAANNVTYGKIQQGAGNSVLGVAGGSTADYAEITSAGNNRVLRMSGGSLNWGVVVPAAYQNCSTYTPTLTNVANLGASTAYLATYHQFGDRVFVFLKVDVDPTTPATLTQLGISLPVASNLANDYECCGSMFASGIAGQGAAIVGDAANNRATLTWIAGDVTNQSMYGMFSYRVI